MAGTQETKKIVIFLSNVGLKELVAGNVVTFTVRRRYGSGRKTVRWEDGNPWEVLLISVTDVGYNQYLVSFLLDGLVWHMTYVIHGTGGEGFVDWEQE